jgi:hypothetical protein
MFRGLAKAKSARAMTGVAVLPQLLRRLQFGSSPIDVITQPRPGNALHTIVTSWEPVLFPK